MTERMLSKRGCRIFVASTVFFAVAASIRMALERSVFWGRGKVRAKAETNWAAGSEDAPSEEWGGRGRPRHAERALGDLNRCTVRDENPNGHQDGLHLRHSVDCARGGAVRCLRDLENQISYGDVDGTN